MNKKKEIIKLIIYIIIIVLVNILYYAIKQATLQVWQCITAPCPQTNSINLIPYLIGCIIISCVFGFLAIRSIIKLIKNK